MLTEYDGTAGVNADIGYTQAALPNVTLTIMAGDNVQTDQYNYKPRFSAGTDGKTCFGILGPMELPSPCDSLRALDRTAATRHLEGANYAFADGHVKFYKPASLYGGATPFATSGNNPTFRAKE